MNNEYDVLTGKFVVAMAAVKAPLAAYIEGLENAIDDLKVALTAAREDLKRAEASDE